MAMKRQLRAIASASALAALALGLAACGGDGDDSGDGSSDGGGELVIASLGGSYQEAQSAAFFKPFAEESGVKVTEANWDGTVGPLKTQVEAGNPQWDVVDLGAVDARQAAEEDLLEPLDESRFADLNLFDGALTESYVATIYSSNVIAWNTDQLSSGPSNAADFFDLDKFPGKRALPGYSPYATLELALLADGVAKEDLYPLDVDRALAKLDTIKDQSVFYDSNEQGMQLLTSGEVAAASVPNGRVYNAIQEGEKVDYTWQDGVLYIDYWGIPKGAKNVDEAMDFLVFASAAEPQVKLTELIPYGGSNQDANALIPAERQADLPTGADNLALQVQPDLEWYSANLTELSEKWESWLLS